LSRWVPGAQDDSDEQVIANAFEHLPSYMLMDHVVVERQPGRAKRRREADITPYLSGTSMHRDDVPEPPVLSELEISSEDDRCTQQNPCTPGCWQ